MGYGIILGGGADLNYGWVNATSYANLPSGKPANTIGFITTTAVPNVYFQNGTVSGMATGDVVIRQGVTSSNPFNLLQVGKLYINASGAYQYSGSAWVAIAAYLYTGSAWVLLSEIYYDNGTIPASVNDFLSYKSSGTTITLTKNAGDMLLAASSAIGWAYSQYPVDLTYISTLRVTAKVSADGMFFGVLSAYNSSSGLVSVNVSSGSYANYSLDVSAITGNKYLAFGTTSSTTRNIYVQKIWGA